MKQNKLSHDEIKEFKAKIRKSFAQFRRMGYFARQNFMCCQTCAWAEIPKNESKKAVFYHNQDSEDILSGKLHVAWSGDGDEIVKVFNSNGLFVSWAGVNKSRIIVMAKEGL